MEEGGGGEQDKVTDTPLSTEAVFSLPGTTNSGKGGKGGQLAGGRKE